MDCWVGSSLAQVMALMAQPPGRRDTWPGQDGCWARISGHWPILWELLSHAVWRRTDGVGSTYGHATGFISVKNSLDVIAFSHQHSSISKADRDDWASQEEKKKKLLQINFKTKTFLLFHLHWFFSLTPYVHPRCSNLIANHHFYLPYCVEVTICSS